MVYAAAVAEMKLIAATELNIGQTTKEHMCPFCGGGNTKEKAFSLTRTEVGLLYKCHRAKCGKHGFVPTMLNTLQVKEQPHQRRATRPYTGETEPVPHKLYAHTLLGKYGLTDDECAEFRMDTKAGRIVQPWHTALGHVGGVVLRGYHGQQPKSLVYWDNDDVPILDYYGLDKVSGESVIWLVEDQLSAIKLSRYVPCAALLGSTISDQQAADIRKYFKNVFLALDNDATVKAIQQSMKYKLYFRNFFVVPLSKDIKDRDDGAIRELLYNYNCLTGHE